MNCKPKDLCVVLAPQDSSSCPATGMFCTTIRLALPGEEVRLPDGRTCVPQPGQPFRAAWVIKYASAVPCHSTSGCESLSIYDVIPESRLQPIRGNGASCETRAKAVTAASEPVMEVA